MLSIYESNKVGIQACINRIGEDLFKNRCTVSTTGHGEVGTDRVFCFAACSRESHYPEGQLILSECPDKGWDYMAKCLVNRNTAEVEYI